MPTVKAPSASETVVNAITRLRSATSEANELVKLADELNAGTCAGREFYAVAVFKDVVEHQLGREISADEWMDIRERLDGAVGDIMDDDLEGHLEQISGISGDLMVGDTY